MTLRAVTVVVVKLGGSLIQQPTGLRALAQALATAPRELRVVVVPGGGPFADAVRKCQTSLNLDDVTAHDMAIAAMGLFGRILVRLTGGLAGYGADGVAAGARRTGPPLIWLPDPEHDARSVPQDWESTSDTLALWLADRIGANQLILVKSAPAADDGDPDRLAALGIVDANYPRLCRQTPSVEKRLVFDADARALRQALAELSCSATSA